MRHWFLVAKTSMSKAAQLGLQAGIQKVVVEDVVDCHRG
jgi:hypothetical protein